ncbi:MAG: hypothetical protein M3Z18_11420 [Gemmatimonadota bacterium]|nr:hypothetical protein [Gemmatimonadota bacterium]
MDSIQQVAGGSDALRFDLISLQEEKVRKATFGLSRKLAVTFVPSGGSGN